MSETKYPLCWPHGKPRTPKIKQKHSAFKGTTDKNRRELFDEIGRLGGSSVILSTNIKLRQDGFPYASQRAPDDVGVALYFDYNNSKMCFACDKWNRIADNIKSITKTINAIRGIERWGSSDMMQQAFTGFEALPNPAQNVNKEWWDVLECRRDASVRVIEANYKRLRFDKHPDRGGSAQEFIQVQDAYKVAMNESSS